ncbi:recombinase family protein [Agrobacterium radiobacter]|uniref:Resolvase protein n=1 Tax=Agrobacterium tumefaciens str. B6 TaxID=1183423 RepID=A0A822UYA7_AGRTU|nr:recombinase family protein [Agrobacterium tumefaciens]KWT83976.1 recombinase [Agrobacterium tumefaciens str. B6]MQB28820.1 recombinase family protein [Agrobacterium tumefaciens]NTA08784.1 recombinase family protein [Agrobacterium tumefaciens]NTA95232.1 recombinase family protein [Agrobacterium tumefaciens]NTB16430.1 recombinase family protein [Agrobacterium tumefaciens]
MTQIHPRVRFIGYARVSTEGQDLAYQIERLKRAGCVEIFHEKRSGKNRDNRPELTRLLASLQLGDVMLATATDRVARDPLDLVNILKTVKDAGAGLRLLDEPFIDTTSEMADLIAFLVGWAACWQRRRILENTAQGREAARQRGVKFGRPSKLGQGEREKIAARRAQGDTCGRIADDFCVSKSTIRRLSR